jgi:hypothetical protein
MFFITVHETDGICICKGVVLDVAKSLTFPLPLLAVAHQQFILGTDLKTKMYFGLYHLMFRSNLVPSYLLHAFPFSGSTHVCGDDDIATLVKVYPHAILFTKSSVESV